MLAKTGHGVIPEPHPETHRGQTLNKRTSRSQGVTIS